MLTKEYRDKVLKEYQEAAKVFEDIMCKDIFTSTNFILFKQLTDINNSLKGINDQLNRISNSINNLSN